MNPILDGGFLFAYFRQINVSHGDAPSEEEQPLAIEALHYALSDDGFHFQTLNGNKPVLRLDPSVGTLRDPFIGRAPDGSFHLVGTQGVHPQLHALHWHSRDLTNWGEVQRLPLIAAHPELRNIWAPEWVWDAHAGEFFVFWSSATGKYGSIDSRIWCARTRDWHHFSPSRVLFDPGYTVIDSTLLPHDGWWWMAFKDERGGGRDCSHCFLKIARSRHLDGPYEVVTEAVTAPTTEGPALLAAPDGDGWLMFYDSYFANRYSASRSRDLLSWEEVAVSLPAEARHGCVVPLTSIERQPLLETYGSPCSAEVDTQAAVRLS